MELYRNEVPGDTVWALLVRSAGMYDWNEYVRWFITPEESSAEYRETVAYHQSNGSGGTVQRWKVTLPRRRMEVDAVHDFVEDALMIQPGPSGNTQLLDVSIQKPTPGPVYRQKRR